MTRLRKTIFAAATTAAVLGGMAATSNADAFSFSFNGGGGKSFGISIGQPSCWRWVPTPWGPQWQKVWGSACYYY